jgi:hypothetical protein
MVDTLQTEGYSINDRELIRLRLRLKLLLRESVPRPKKKTRADGGVQKKTKHNRPKIVPGPGLINQLGNAILAEDSSSEESEDEARVQEQDTAEQTQALQDPSIQQEPEDKSAPLSPEEALRKQLRQEQLRSESAAGPDYQQTHPANLHASHLRRP